MSALLYHYTDTARLPWIIQEQALRPGRNRIGGFPDPDFLWATALPYPDRTASASLEALRGGLTRSVHFTLSTDEFQRWPEIVETYPAWTREQVARLEKAARGQSSPRDWWCRASTLPRTSWLAIETRSYRDSRWSPFDPDEPVLDLSEGAIGVMIGDVAYCSTKFEGPAGADGYRVFLGKRSAAA